MAKNKNTFVFYSDWTNMITAMSNEDAGQLIKHILSYVNDEDPTTKNELIKVVFAHIKPILKADLQKWDKKLKIYSDMGKSSSIKRKKQPTSTYVEPTSTYVEPTLTYVEPTSTVNVNVNDNVNDNVNVNVNDINKRIVGFKKSLHPFYSKYGLEILKDFYEYWSEHNENGKKMRFEYAKNQPFNIDRRLQTWLKRHQEFKKEKNFAPKKEKINAGELLKQKYGLS